MATNIASIEAIFSEALEIPAAEARAAFLDRACAADSELRRQVESLLDAHDRAGRFLASPTVSFSSEPPEPVGSTVGPYKLMEQIGECGMGVVYVAEQTQPVRRKVALKIIKPGMDTKQVIARFEAERQALAMMDHPNIAKVHDGGATESGRPYFVMELVRGIPITDYCDRERLSIPERLELFVLVCRAVQHAHQKGIIHRDLKPSNILVTVIDGVAVPKVIDFGVAKATGASLTERTIYTAFHQFVGTPLYMSPEQADLAGMDVDTRSDIYSLGVLLYELLTGTTPFDQETFRTAAFDEVRRIIREQEPPKPSTRLSSLGTTRATVSANRKADARKLDRTVRGELDWVVMKAMEKDRRRRYEAANDFAADVMRYLTDRPVEACPPSAWYRVRKFAGRNRRSLATTAVLMVSGLIIGGVLLAVQLENVGRVRQLGQDVRQALAGARTAIEARDLTLASQRVAEAQGRLGANAASLPDLAASSSSVRREIDARQADAARFDQFLKGASDAEDQRDKAGIGDESGDRVAERTLGLYGILNDKDWLSRLEVSYLTADQKQQVRETAYVTLVSLADYYIRWRKSEPKSVERSLDLLQRAQAFHQPTRAFYFARGDCRRRQGDIVAATEDEKQFQAAPARTAWDYYLPGHTAGWGGDLDEAIRSYQAALRLQPNHYNSLFFLAMRLSTDKINRLPEAIAYFTACIALRPNDFVAYRNRGSCYAQFGQLDAAKADFEAELAVVKNTLGEKHPNTLHSMNCLACFYWDQEKLSQAETLFVTAVESSRRVRGEEHHDTLLFMGNLAGLYRGQGKLAQAESLFVRVLEVRRRTLGEEHSDTMAAMNDVAVLYMDQDKFAQAEALLVKLLEVRRRVQGKEHPETIVSMRYLGHLYKLTMKLDRSIPLLEAVLKWTRGKLGPDHPDTLNTMDNLGDSYRAAGRLPEAIDLLEQAWLRARKQPALPVAQFTSIPGTLGRTYEQAGRFAKAESLYGDALKTVRQRNKEASSDSAYLQVLLAGNLLEQRRYAEAEPLLREGLKFREQHEPNDWRTFSTKSALGGSLLGQKKHAEAEPLLLAGHEGMKQREMKIPPIIRKVRLTEAIERLVQLYEAWGQLEKAAEWRAKLPPAAAELLADVFARP